MPQNFLGNYQKEHPNSNFEIIGTYFERYKDTTLANKHLKEYKRVMGNSIYQISVMSERQER